ncbi:MAG TPA: ParB/RepB/Spo0J family partition protein [Patescibacteria group bacterium]|nr:ParB/RepB/Spo0J family partition protein [Patescibacteria group bacterium]
MNKQRGLGRGLDALFSGANTRNAAVDGEIQHLSLLLITPNRFQPRRVFDEEALADLAQSIKQHGVLQPIMVRKTVEGYELIAGERRWRASQLAGLKTIPAILKDYTDGEMTEIALVENLQRENLNPIEEAIAYKKLMEEFGLTQEEVARKIGRSRSLIANTVRLLQLHQDVQQHVWQGTLTNGQVRPLLAIEKPELQIEAANRIIEEGLSARDVEAMVRQMLNRRERRTEEESLEASEKEEAVSPPERNFFLEEIEDRLKMMLGTQVKIKAGKTKSKIEIEFYSSEDLERLLEALSGAQHFEKASEPVRHLVV